MSNIDEAPQLRESMEEFQCCGLTVPKLSIIVGGILAVWGIAAYIISDMASITAMIPAFMGAPILLMGFLSERITARYALMINFTGQAVFLILMTWAASPVVMWISVPLYGYFNGAFGALFQLVVQNAFGIRHYGSIMGSINLTTMVSFGIGPILAGASFDLTGSYTVVFVIVAVLFLIGALSMTQAGMPEHRPVRGEVSA